MNLNRLRKLPLSRLIKKVLGYDEVYAIAIRKGYPGLLMNDNETPFQIIEGKLGYWYADPVVVKNKDKTYVFAEAYDRKNFRGHIEVIELLNDMTPCKGFTKVLQEPYHMSFPMVFKWNDDFFMIPETSENMSINLYKAIEFPYVWKMEKKFNVDNLYVDTIVISNEPQKITCLTSMISKNNPLMSRYQKFSITHINDEIEISWDKDFNEKQEFSYESRNAGPVFMNNQKKYIPTQTSTRLDYGVEVVYRQFSDIDLFDSNYTKKIDYANIKDIDRKDILGIHTYSTTEKIEVIDVRYNVFSPMYQWRKILR